jgi:hypothetical protein
MSFKSKTAKTLINLVYVHYSLSKLEELCTLALIYTRTENMMTKGGSEDTHTLCLSFSLSLHVLGRIFFGVTLYFLDDAIKISFYEYIREPNPQRQHRLDESRICHLYGGDGAADVPGVGSGHRRRFAQGHER